MVRLFPSSMPQTARIREAVVQATLVEQGFPAPRIVWFDDAARLLGRRFFVMERLEGHSMQGGNRFSDIAQSGPRVVARLATVTASTQATLHRLDAASLVTRLPSCRRGWSAGSRDSTAGGAGAGWSWTRAGLAGRTPTGRRRTRVHLSR